MTRVCLAAFTPPISPMPPFVNMSVDERGVTIMVRGAAPGSPFAEITMTVPEFRSLLGEAVSGLLMARLG